MIMMEFFSRCTKWTIKNLCISDQNFWNPIMCSCDSDIFGKAKEGSQFSCYLELLFYLFVFYFFPFLSPVISIQNFNHKNTRNTNWLLLLIMSSPCKISKLYYMISIKRANYFLIPKLLFPSTLKKVDWNWFCRYFLKTQWIYENTFRYEWFRVTAVNHLTRFSQ